MRRDVPPESARVRGIITIASRDQPELTILTGDFAPRIPAHHETWRAVSPEPGFLFIGEIEIVNAALAAWRDTNRKPPAWAARIREVSAAYDNWLVALDPIPGDRRGIAGSFRERRRTPRRASGVMRGVSWKAILSLRTSVPHD